MCDKCIKACNAINKLTPEFGDSVKIVNTIGYPTAKGRHAIQVCNEKSLHLNSVVEGTNLLDDCLESAVKARRDADGKEQ